MSFVSVVFCLFLPVVFAAHYLARNHRWQNTVLLIASYLFYGWWDYRFCGLLLAGSLIDYWAAQGIASSKTPRARKLFLLVSLIGNLGLLGFFKYFNFFTDSLVTLIAALGLDLNTSTLNIILPVGISFYTFQTMSYTIDIYRGQFQPRRDLIEYLTFVSFFPQLVAGPIERARDLLPQFGQRRMFSHDAAVAGCRLIVWGLLKKMVLADNLAPFAEAAFSNPQTATSAELVFGTICFAFQIYGDFSGYSDIAAGIAGIFGIRLSRNFAYPYFSQSVTEFWRRWHISLSTWFRDYVFIPLGGSRARNSRAAANVIATMTISGLWHGAAWHFVIWGLFHGALIAVNHVTRRSRPPIPEIPGGPGLVPTPMILVRMAITFAIVCAGWVLFRAESMPEASYIYVRIAGGVLDPSFYGNLLALMIQQLPSVLLLVLFVGVEWFGRFEWNPLPLPRESIMMRWGLYTVVVWVLVLFGTQHGGEFIYFQF